MKFLKKLHNTKLFALCVALLLCVICFSINTFASESYDFANFTEEEAIAFVEQNNIEIPEEFLGLDDFHAFTLQLIKESYNNPNVEFCFSYNVTQRYAEEIRSTVNSYINSPNFSRVVSRTTYSLQHNKVMDENGNWVTSGGYFNPKWLNYNCYAYSINRAEQPSYYMQGYTFQYQPGDMCGEGRFANTTTIDELALIVKNDLTAMGYANISLSTTIPTIDSSQELICVRRCSNYDYHFMRYDIETDSWYHKPGRTAVLKYNYIPSNGIVWYSEYSDMSGEHAPTFYYDSSIIFITYSKNQINVMSSGTSTLYINPRKDLFYEINLVYSENHEIKIEAPYNFSYEIYSSEFDLINSGNGTQINNVFYLSEGKYYLRVNCTENVYSYVSICIRALHQCSHQYIPSSTSKHTSYCECGYSTEELHYFFNGSCTLCGMMHEHDYTGWEYYSNFQHIQKCDCGQIGTTKKPHVLRSSDTGRYKMCIKCNTLIDTNTGGGLINSTKVMVSLNGSYIMPNGIIILVDEDINAYLNGDLIFYDPNENTEII